MAAAALDAAKKWRRVGLLLRMGTSPFICFFGRAAPSLSPEPVLRPSLVRLPWIPQLCRRDRAWANEFKPLPASAAPQPLNY
jgi:hypothetical protein